MSQFSFQSCLDPIQISKFGVQELKMKSSIIFNIIHVYDRQLKHGEPYPFPPLPLSSFPPLRGDRRTLDAAVSSIRRRG